MPSRCGRTQRETLRAGSGTSPSGPGGNGALSHRPGEPSAGAERHPSGDGDGGYSLPAGEQNKIINYSQTFNLTKFDATDVLTVHIFTNKGEEIIIELEKSK